MEIYCKHCDKNHSKEECIVIQKELPTFKYLDYFCPKTGEWLVTEFFFDEEEKEKYAFLKRI